jgi:hypothetical protein
MSKIEARGSNASDSSDWNRAWEAVSRLAAARGTTLPKVERAQPAAAEPKAAPATAPAPAPALPPPAADLPLAPVARDQLARDIAEIEQAAAALRRSEPSLEPRFPDSPPRTELRKVRSIWILVALIWLSAASVVSCAIGAIFLLFG